MRQRLEGITRQQQQWQRRSSRRCSYGRWNQPRPALFCCSRQSLPIARPAQITNYRVVSGAGHCRASSRPAPWSEEHRYQPPPCKGAATSLQSVSAVQQQHRQQHPKNGQKATACINSSMHNVSPLRCICHHSPRAYLCVNYYRRVRVRVAMVHVVPVPFDRD